jgi:hypothetical protein
MAMKRLFTVLATMLFLTITACTPGGWGDPPAKQQRIIKNSTYTAEAILTDYETYSYDSNNRLITATHYDALGNLKGSVGFDYDASNRLSIAYVYNPPPALFAYAQYSYNSSGLVDRLTFYYYYFGTPVLMFYNAYEYNASGKTLLGGTYQAPLYLLSSSWGYEYNVNGLMGKVTFYDASGNTTSYLTLDYDAGGNAVTMWKYDPSATLTGRTEYSYNTDGKVIQISNYTYSEGNAVLAGYTTIEYEDGQGNYDPLDLSSPFKDFFDVISSFKNNLP